MTEATQPVSVESSPSTTTSAETTSLPASTTPAAPAAEESEAISCGDVGVTQGPARLACALLSKADPEVCPSLSFKFLTIAFGASGERGIDNCRERIEARFRGSSNVTVAPAEESSTEATVTVTRITRDGVLDAQRVSLVKQGGEWVIDGLGATDPVLTVEDSESADEITQITLSWYAQLDEAVCNVMTDTMLRFGWGKRGDAGREACRAGLRDATPLQDVEPRTPAIVGDTAVVQVDYGPPDERLFDRIRFTRTAAGWQIDRIVGSGFVEE